MATLTDGRIALRPPERRDASAIADAVQASLTELEPWMPWASSAYDDSAALEWNPATKEVNRARRCAS